jgi:hypothetical protein
MVSVAERAYAHWYKEGQVRTPRLGVPATVMQAIWRVDIESASLPDLRSASALVRVYCLGLRESSTLSLLASHVRISEDKLVVRPSVSKGATVDHRLAVYRPISAAFPSPIDLYSAWYRRRTTDFHWLSLEEEPNLRLGILTAILGALGTPVSADCRLLFPQTAKRLAHRAGAASYTVGSPQGSFWLGPEISDGGSLFDRSIRQSATSTWFSGPWFLGPTAGP